MNLVKRFLGFSTMEWVILMMGICGMAALWFCFPEKWWKVYCTGFGLGFLFESSMERLFTYNKQLSQRHCIRNSDLNFLLPFAWLNIVGLTAVIAEKTAIMPLLPAYILAAIIAGNINEFIFFKCKFWRYNYKAPMFGNFRPFMPVITLKGVPIQVIIGYANVGLMIYCLTHILF